MTTKVNLPVFGFDIIKPVGLIFLALSLFLLFSSFGVLFRKLGGFSSYMERIMADNWLIVIEVGLLTLIAAWVAGRNDIQQNNWFYQPYLWSVGIWMIFLLAVFFTVIVYHIYYRFVKVVGWLRSAPMIVGLFIVGIAVWFLVTGIREEGKTIQVITSFAVVIIIILLMRKYWSTRMNINKIFRLQDRAASENVRWFETRFQWCHRSVELMLDTHTFLANDPKMFAYRERLSKSAVSEFEAMNVVVNMAYDAMGSLISALRLLEYGVLADAWSLIRVAFESTCYAEFFALNKSMVRDYLQIVETIKYNRSADVAKEVTKLQLAVKKVMKSLQDHDGQNRTYFYSRLCNFGTHASPIRSGLRIRADEPEVRAYLSIGHRELIQCLADFAATAKYTLGIPFDAWPKLMQRKASLFKQYQALLEGYKAIYDPAWNTQK